MSKIINGYICETDEDINWVEDRCSRLNLEKAKCEYYESCTRINNLIFEVMEEMSTEELKSIIMRKPIIRLKH